MLEWLDIAFLCGPHRAFPGKCDELIVDVREVGADYIADNEDEEKTPESHNLGIVQL